MIARRLVAGLLVASAGALSAFGLAYSVGHGFVISSAICGAGLAVASWIVAGLALGRLP